VSQAKPAGTSSWTANVKKDAPVVAAEEAAPIVTFQKLSDAEPVKYLKIAVTGRPKTGKTRFALSCPSPIYVIETEPGLKPLKKLFPDKEIFYIDAYEPDPSGIFEADVTKSIAKIDAAVKIIRKMCIEKPDSVGTVVLDSVTDVWKWVMEWMKLDILKIDRTARVKQQWDYGYANTKYQNIIMQLISLPVHIVLTAQDKEEYAGAGQPSGVYEPSWMWQTPQWVDLRINLVRLQSAKEQSVKYVGSIIESRHMDEDKVSLAGEVVYDIDFDKVMGLVKRKKE
jgi:hypothetical protein